MLILDDSPKPQGKKFEGHLRPMNKFGKVVIKNDKGLYAYSDLISGKDGKFDYKSITLEEGDDDINKGYMIGVKRFVGSTNGVINLGGLITTAVGDFDVLDKDGNIVYSIGQNMEYGLFREINYVGVNGDKLFYTILEYEPTQRNGQPNYSSINIGESFIKVIDLKTGLEIYTKGYNGLVYAKSLIDEKLITTRGGVDEQLIITDEHIVFGEDMQLESFSNGVSVFTSGGALTNNNLSTQWWINNHTDTHIMMTEWDWIGPFSEGKALAYKDNRAIIINNEGRELFELCKLTGYDGGIIPFFELNYGILSNNKHHYFRDGKIYFNGKIYNDKGNVVIDFNLKVAAGSNYNLCEESLIENTGDLFILKGDDGTPVKIMNRQGIDITTDSRIERFQKNGKHSTIVKVDDNLVLVSQDNGVDTIEVVKLSDVFCKINNTNNPGFIEVNSRTKHSLFLIPENEIGKIRKVTDLTLKGKEVSDMGSYVGIDGKKFNKKLLKLK